MNQSTEIDARLAQGTLITRAAAASALQLFRDLDSLDIEPKGLQDWVSNADKSVEDQIRHALVNAFPDDGVIGEEHGTHAGTSGYTWIIDPIDGTSNFINGIPAWCVVLACVYEQQCVCAVICDPVSEETFTASRGQGAWVNDKRLQVSQVNDLREGSLAVGHSTRVSKRATLSILDYLLENGGLFRRSGSGALDLAYVAAGRMIGFVEAHMNAWDCVAALLMIEEAGGHIEPFEMQSMIEQGGRVIACCPGIYSQVLGVAQNAFDDA